MFYFLKTEGNVSYRRMLSSVSVKRERMLDGISRLYLFTVGLQWNALTVAVRHARLAYCRKKTQRRNQRTSQHQHRLTTTQDTASAQTYNYTSHSISTDLQLHKQHTSTSASQRHRSISNQHRNTYQAGN